MPTRCPKNVHMTWVIITGYARNLISSGHLFTSSGPHCPTNVLLHTIHDEKDAQVAWPSSTLYVQEEIWTRLLGHTV